MSLLQVMQGLQIHRTSLSAGAPVDRRRFERVKVDAIKTAHVDRDGLAAVRLSAARKGLDTACCAERTAPQWQPPA